MDLVGSDMTKILSYMLRENLFIHTEYLLSFNWNIVFYIEWVISFNDNVDHYIGSNTLLLVAKIWW